MNTAEREEPLTNTDRIRELEALIAALRSRESDELRELRAANRHMAQHIQALSLLVQDHQRRLAAKIQRLAS